MNRLQNTWRQAVIGGIVGLILTVGVANANYLQLANVGVLPENTTNALVQFDISWENSWRFDDVNHDAAWVFFKVQDQSAANLPWKHATLVGTGLNNAYHFRGTQVMPVDTIVPDDAVGMFIRRSGEGSGTFEAKHVRARIDLAALGLDDTDEIVVQAYGVEMVYVPEGSFWLGSGGATATDYGTFVDGSWVGSGSSTSYPFRVTSEAVITIGPNPGQLWGTITGSGHASIGPEGSLSASFPKGYAAFYMMKFPVTQGQFRDFLNSLTRTQQTAGDTANSYTVAANAFLDGGSTTAPRQRSGIRAPAVLPDAGVPIVFGCDLNNNGTFDEKDDGEYLAMAPVSPYWANRITWWMGLRPTTELEFEKAAKGTNYPVANAYVWGDASAPNVASSYTDVDKGTSTADTEARNAHILASPLGGVGPVRVGKFATANTTRLQSGASYYGIMNLGDNVLEQYIGVGDELGAGGDYSRPFTGVHGSGELPASGIDNAPNWPYTNNSTDPGRGWRGNYFRRNNEGDGRISDRTSAMRRDNRGQTGHGSWRAGRTAPAVAAP